MEIIKVKLKITNEDLAFEEKVDLIISNLRSLADRIEECNGDAQALKGRDEDSSIEYVHIREA